MIRLSGELNRAMFWHSMAVYTVMTTDISINSHFPDSIHSKFTAPFFPFPYPYCANHWRAMRSLESLLPRRSLDGHGKQHCHVARRRDSPIQRALLSLSVHYSIRTGVVILAF